MKLSEKMTRTINKTIFKVKKASPDILIVVGTIGVITATVKACMDTPKAIKVIESKKGDLDKIKNLHEQETSKDEYSEEDYKKDLLITYVKTGVELFVVYSPSIIIGALSLTSIWSSHHILKKRNVALTAAYTLIDKSFSEYRKRVADKIGEEAEKDIHYGINKEQVIEKELNAKGKEKEVKKNYDVVDNLNCSPYARFFDESSKSWSKDSETNLIFLNSQQSFANDRLRAYGYLFLNDVYDALGIPRTKAGQIIGWVYDPSNPKGDNYVDFGIYNLNRTKARDFVNGYERVILLDFNVDGNIIDKLPKE